MKTCNSCRSEVMELKNFGSFPIVNNFEIAKNCQTFDFRLGICSICGLSQLIDVIDSSEFYTNYATLSSHKPNPHTNELMLKLQKYINLEAKIMEVGCNDGTFLDVLLDNGYTNIFGLEPTNNGFEVAFAKGHNVAKNFLNMQTVPTLTQDGLFDVVITRQVLEHITNLQEFGLSLNRLLKPGGLLVIEVPNSIQNLMNYDYGLWEEHVNYFTPFTLKTYLSSVGFETIDEWYSLFSGECLSLIARKVEPVSHFNKNYAENEIVAWKNWSDKFQVFKDLINEEVKILSKDKPIILYGVGARSSVFVNFLELSDKLSFAIDDAPFKQNKFMPFSKTEIISSSHDKIKSDGGYLILLGVNAENEKKLIENSFVSQNSFISILPPSEYLPKSWKQFIKNH